MFVAGIDGTTKGWIAAIWAGPGNPLNYRRMSNIAELEVWPERPEVVAIDIPIGITDAARKGGRSCEIEVRQPTHYAMRALPYEVAPFDRSPFG